MPMAIWNVFRDKFIHICILLPGTGIVMLRNLPEYFILAHSVHDTYNAGWNRPAAYSAEQMDNYIY